MPSLPTTYLSVGKTVIEKAHPDQEWKVLAVFYDYMRGGIEFAYLENTKSKDRVFARFDDYTDIDPAEEKLWRDTWKPAATPLSAELIVMKKDASVVSDSDKSLMSTVMMPYLTRKAGISQDKMEAFLNNANYTRNGNKVFITLGNRTMVATIDADSNEVCGVQYIRKEGETTAPMFFNDQKLVLYAMNPGYAIDIDGKQTYLDDEDLGDFCDDWNLSLDGIKGRLVTTGRCTIGRGE